TMRDQYNLNQAEPLENTPPLVAFTTVALGGFRECAGVKLTNKTAAAKTIVLKAGIYLCGNTIITV
ncbi:MAG: hypothetical protein ACQEQL_03715, partial [Pseudomonadota bacterium]